MYQHFFAELSAAKVPVSLREYLSFLEALDARLARYDAEGFYISPAPPWSRTSATSTASTASSLLLLAVWSS